MDSNRLFQAVIFDMDGLLIDSERIVLEGWRLITARMGIQIPNSLVPKIIGRTMKDGEAIVKGELGEDFPYLEVREKVQQHLQEAFQQNLVPKKPGVDEILDMLEVRDIPKVVATSTYRKEATNRLRSVHLLDRFPAFVGGDEVEKGKPAPDLFYEAALRIGVQPGRCIVLEDSEPGIRAARNGGMLPIFVPDLHPPSEETVQIAEYIFPSLHEVRTFLADLPFQSFNNNRNEN